MHNESYILYWKIAESQYISSTGILILYSGTKVVYVDLKSVPYRISPYFNLSGKAGIQHNDTIVAFNNGAMINFYNINFDTSYCIQTITLPSQNIIDFTLNKAGTIVIYEKSDHSIYFDDESWNLCNGIIMYDVVKKSEIILFVNDELYSRY